MIADLTVAIKVLTEKMHGFEADLFHHQKMSPKLSDIDGQLDHAYKSLGLRHGIDHLRYAIGLLEAAHGRSDGSTTA